MGASPDHEIAMRIALTAAVVVPCFALLLIALRGCL